MIQKPVLLSALLAGLAGPLSSAAVLNTIATSGYNADVFFEAGLAPGDSFAGNGKGISRAFGLRAFYQTGAYSSTPTLGTNPSNNGLTTTAGNTANFNFQPFNASNAMFVSSNVTKTTLTLTGAATGYSTLGFVASASNLGQVDLAEFTYTINYAGGGSQIGTFTVDDWGATSTAGSTDNISMLQGTAKQLLASPRAGQGASATPGPSTLFSETVNQNGAFRFYLAEITPNSTDAILSIDFTATKLDPNGVRSGALTDAAVFGLLGSPVSVPEPSTAVLAAGALGFVLLRRRK